MKAIKKVAVTPVQVNNGTIIDSFNTSDDKHTNAPSINAVENKIQEVQKETLTISNNSSISGSFVVRRNGKVVNIITNLTITANSTYIQIDESDLDKAFPAWAMPTEQVFQNFAMYEDNSLDTTGYVYIDPTVSDHFGFDAYHHSNETSNLMQSITYSID